MNLLFHFKKQELLKKKFSSYSLKVIYKYDSRSFFIQKIANNLGLKIELPSELRKISAVREFEKIQQNLNFNTTINIEKIENFDLYKIVYYGITSEIPLKDSEFLLIMEKLKKLETDKIIDSLLLLKENIPYLDTLHCKDNDTENYLKNQQDCQKLKYLDKTLKIPNIMNSNLQLIEYQKNILSRGKLRINMINISVGSVLAAVMVILLYEVLATSIKTPKFIRKKK